MSVCVCVCFSLAVPQEMTRWYESCSNNCTFGFFTKNEAEFLGWIIGTKLGKYMINFGVVVVSDMCIFVHSVRKCSSVSGHSQHAVRAESVLTREPGSVCAGPSLRPDCVHWVCTSSMSLSLSLSVCLSLLSLSLSLSLSSLSLSAKEKYHANVLFLSLLLIVLRGFPL